MSAKTRIAVAGSGGRMGRMLLEAVFADPAAELAAALEVKGSPQVGRDAGELAGVPGGVRISDDAEKVLSGCDVLIDFTRPEGTLHHLELCRRLKVR
ncbi:MAG: 4-hydroxy-tetrahydrodipicolinate reductase, partial [Betaproteobacteria bacterium]|nr:4-hydroxy-tetrahydrodipicolinate reductase [Betaproteobacteria bacterium]